MKERDDSDYDIFIILPDKIDVKEKMKNKSLLRKELVNYDVLADILIESKEEVGIKKNLLGHIVREAIKEGKMI